MKALIIESNIIDANIFARKIMQTALYDASSILVAKTLNEGLELYSNHFFDLVFTSLSLSDARGAQIIEKIVDSNHTVPIVVTTNDNKEELVFDSFRVGAEEFLNVKEITIRGLKRCITHAIERKKLKNKLATALVKEKLASSAKTSFLANMSHEIRTPLNLIIGSADLLNETSLDKKQRKLVETFQRSGEHLLTIISDILDMSKIESGEFNLYNTEFNLLEALKGISNLLSVCCKSKGLEFICDFDEKLDGLIVGDQDRLKQILFNLLNNSVKFTGEGYVKLKVQLVDDLVRFSIEDSGIGIPEDRKDRIFTSFYQIQDKNYMTSKGTGLGLAIVKELVNKMSGHIYLDTEFSSGAKFIFEIPNTIKPDDRPKKKSKTKIEVNKIKSIPLDILVAEDDLDNRELVSAYLAQSGHRVSFAVDGQDCVDKFKSKNYDLVLMDIQMPKLNGFQATQEIRNIEKEKNKLVRTPIYALSANAFKDDVEQAISSGCDGYLTKPVRKNNIFELIDSISQQVGISNKEFIE